MGRSLGRITLALLLTVAAWPVGSARAGAVVDKFTNAGLLGVTITNLGYVGHAFTYRHLPSGEYPLNSNVEHVYRGGLWVGALNADGERRVSTGSQDANGQIEGDLLREFEAYSDTVRRYLTTEWSNSQNADNYNAEALATQQINCFYNDYARAESGSHKPLGLHVDMRTLAWGSPYTDDFVILDYAIVNISGTELRDVYLGFWIDTTVGNTEQGDPYDPNATVRWNYYDDMNGAWGAEGQVPPGYTPDGDPGIWMAYEHDADGDEGLATSWIGYRLLGTVPAVAESDTVSPVSYNAWSFRRVPAGDDWYYEGDDTTTALPGKYQIMSNGDFDVGETQETDFTIQGNWVGIISTGPFPTWADGDTLRMSWAIVAGPDSLGLLANSKVAQVAYNDGFRIPEGPPSPRLKFDFSDDSVILSWAPGDSVGALGDPLASDDPLRSPEHHISQVTGRPDFQGYRVYRFQGETITEDPYNLATLVAEYDKIDGVGFDTGLPPLNEDGRREIVDTNLLDGFPYWYSVVSFSAPDLEAGLPEFQSGFNENAKLVYPGPGPVSDGSRTVGVYPNPYRAASMFDNQNRGELGRKLWFTNLPARCTIKIFTVSGDLVRTLEHDNPVEGQKSWDLLSGEDRAIASGLYIYAVEDLDTGGIQRGKLVIIK